VGKFIVLPITNTHNYKFMSLPFSLIKCLDMPLTTALPWFVET